MLWIILSAPLVLAVVFWLRKKWQKKQRQQIFDSPFPPSWLVYIQQNIRLYSRLPKGLQQQLLGHVQVFLSEKRFYGFEGLQINDEIRVTVAAQACVLQLNRRATYFPGFTSIYMYPASYRVQERHSNGEVSVGSDSVRLGESWTRGPVVLSWRDSKQGGVNEEDGHNVVIHEFAHKLDEENGAVDGLPPLTEDAQYKSWADVLGKEFHRLQTTGGRSVIDRYGATNAQEFFAVVTETFFEKPRQLQEKHTGLYDEFKRFYRLDPSSWYE